MNLRLSRTALAVVLLSAVVAHADDRVLSLAGTWQFERGGPEPRDDADTLPKLTYADSIMLPGTTATRQKGPPSDSRDGGQLTQPFNFVGPCWYARGVDIPDGWHGKRVTLLLERTKFSHCWVDGKSIGTNAFVCTPQEYDLGPLTPGKHTLTLAVDNRRLPPFGADSHQYSGNTQGNWNGVIGRIELRATDAVRLDAVQAYPDAAGRAVTVKARVHNAGVNGVDVVLSVASDGATTTTTVSAVAGDTAAEVRLPLGPSAALWDEFHPTLHTLDVRLAAPGATDTRSISFGLRAFATHGTQFTINGRPTFLRGKHDACVFPLTGHPPMDVDGWLTYLKTCQSYGLNHIRFHTWCPPDAAFTAADQLGMYLQPELPFWGTFDAKVRTALEPEAHRILACYGNHPSFVMFSMGNEHWAGREVLDALVTALRAADPRHLYVRGSSAFSYEGKPGPNDDYMINSDARAADGTMMRVRGSNGGSSPQGHVQTGPPGTMADYAAAIAGSAKPTISHEMGQYVVFPDFAQLSKYVGATRPYNLEIFRAGITRAGLSSEADAFASASGALAERCYREDIESCLRTPAYGGFELLDLQDYPGQGTALVGILDAFMDSKGIIPPEQWRQFCAPVVLLARFPKYAWTTGETFTAPIDVAQYGDVDLKNVAIQWVLRDAAGKTLSTGELPAVDAPRGDVRRLGALSIPLDHVAAPAKVHLDLELTGTPVRTGYDLWVYPATLDVQPPATVTIARTFDAAAKQALVAGKRVMLVCDQTKPLARTVGGGFATDFWNFSFFHNRPATLGLLCDPATPALAKFPTDANADWQWFDVALQGQPLILDGLLPRGTRPIVQTIDNYERNHTLGLIFEAKVGPGRLLVCATDLVALAPDHLEARQLLASLLSYANSDRFDPQTRLETSTLTSLLRTTIPLAGSEATASSVDKGWQGYEPRQIIDRNDDKGWKADPDAAGPAWCAVKLAKPMDLGGIEITWPAVGPGYRYKVEASTDEKTWTTVAADPTGKLATARQSLPLKARGVRAVRVVIDAMPERRPAALNEIRFFAAGE